MLSPRAITNLLTSQLIGEAIRIGNGLTEYSPEESMDSSQLLNTSCPYEVSLHQSYPQQLQPQMLSSTHEMSEERGIQAQGNEAMPQGVASSSIYPSLHEFSLSTNVGNIEINSNEQLNGQTSKRSLEQNENSSIPTKKIANEYVYSVPVQNQFEVLGNLSEPESPVNVSSIFVYDVTDMTEFTVFLKSVLKETFFTELKFNKVKVQTHSSGDYRLLLNP